jgi:hypothetical protein
MSAYLGPGEYVTWLDDFLEAVKDAPLPQRKCLTGLKAPSLS